MPAASATRPINPSSASISRTRWPLPSPPIAGLHDIAPMLAKVCVISAVRAPRRADAAAASHPAWPPPTTMTSNFRIPRAPKICGLLNLRGVVKADVSRESLMGNRSPFHVKRRVNLSFTNAEIFEDFAEPSLDIAPARHPPERAWGEPQFFRDELFG